MADKVANPFDLKGRVALVSGGSQGLGKAIALALAGAGADLMLPSFGDESGFQETAREATDLGSRVEVVGADMTNIDQIRELFRQVDRRFGRVDILAAVVGPGYRCSAEDIDLQRFERVVYGLTTARFCCCQEAGRRMLKQGRGSIINIGSIGGVTALGRGNFPYSVGMGAVIQMTRELSTEWSGRGVRVNAILPAQVTNPDLESFWKTAPEIQERMLSGIPMGRFGTPADIQGLALLLASDASSFISGAMIPFDGGNLAMNAGGSPGPFKSA